MRIQSTWCSKRLAVFANVGGGFLRQFGWDAGLRYYASGSHLVGFYVDLRYSGFALPEFALWMHGPGLQLGYSWKLKGVAFGLGAGLTTFFELSPARAGATFLGRRPSRPTSSFSRAWRGRSSIARR